VGEERMNVVIFFRKLLWAATAEAAYELTANLANTPR